MLNKYVITLGQYYVQKSGQYHFLDTLLFNTDYGQETLSQDSLELRALQRHGDKRLLEIPDWFITMNSNKYDGSLSSYIGLLQEWLLVFNWNNFTNAKYSSYKRIFNALNAEYSPIENTDRYSEITDTHSGTDSLAKSGTDTTATTGTDGVKFSGSDTTENVVDKTYGKAGSEIVSKTGDDTTTYNSALTTTVDDANITTYAGSETNTRSNTNDITYGKTTTESISGNESNKNTKNGSVLENEDDDEYTFPFNGQSKAHTMHKDRWTNSRYGKYNNSNGDPQSDPYSEISEKTYTDRKNVNTDSGKDLNVENGSDVKTFADRTDSIIKKGTDSEAKSGNDKISFNNKETTTFDQRSDTETGSNTTTVTKDSGETTTHDTQVTTNYGATDTTTYNNTVKHVEHTHGNIGVTTNQAMINEELRLRIESNLMDMIIDDYISTITLN